MTCNHENLQIIDCTTDNPHDQIDLFASCRDCHAYGPTVHSMAEAFPAFRRYHEKGPNNIETAFFLTVIVGLTLAFFVPLLTIIGSDDSAGGEPVPFIERVVRLVKGEDGWWE